MAAARAGRFFYIYSPIILYNIFNKISSICEKIKVFLILYQKIMKNVKFFKKNGEIWCCG